MRDKQGNITKNSSFEDIAQACIEAYYLIPYPGCTDISLSNKQVNRVFHGGLHVARTTLCVELLLELYQKYAPELALNAENKPLTDKDIKLLKLATIYHDSANANDWSGISIEHANNFRRDMVFLGYTESDIEPFARAIEKKDTTPPENFFSKLIHDADCLEIIRVIVDDPFQKNYLHILKDLKTKEGFEKELDQIIENHYETIRLIEGDVKGSSPLHVECEFSANCYNTLKSILHRLLLNQGIMEAASINQVLDVSKIGKEFIPLRDLFNRNNSPWLNELIRPPKEAKENTVLSKYQAHIQLKDTLTNKDSLCHSHEGATMKLS